MDQLESIASSMKLSQREVERYISDAVAVSKEREKVQTDRHAENQESLSKLNTSISQNNLKVAKRGLWIALASCSIGLAGVAFTILAFVAVNWFLKH